MNKSELSEKQIDMLEGRVCPYCKKPAVRLTNSKRFKRPDMKDIMWCEDCKAWAYVVDGEPEGRLFTQEEHGKRMAVRNELGRLIHSEEDKAEVRKSLAVHLNCPEEYADVNHMGMKSLSKILQFCMMNADKSGSRIRWRKPGDPCDEGSGNHMIGASDCKGCPHFLLDDGVYVWCDPDFVYGRMPNK